MSLNFLVRNRSAEETVRMAAVRAQFAEVAGSIRVYFLYFQEGSNPLDRIERRRRSGGPGRRGTAARQAWAHRGTRVCERNAYSRKTLLRLPRIFGDHRSPYWKGCSLDTAHSGTAGDFGVHSSSKFAQARRFRCARGPFRRHRPGARVGVASIQKIPADPRAWPRRSLERHDGGEFKSDRTRAGPQAY